MFPKSELASDIGIGGGGRGSSGYVCMYVCYLMDGWRLGGFAGLRSGLQQFLVVDIYIFLFSMDSLLLEYTDFLSGSCVVRKFTHSHLLSYHFERVSRR